MDKLLGVTTSYSGRGLAFGFDVLDTGPGGRVLIRREARHSTTANLMGRTRISAICWTTVAAEMPLFSQWTWWLKHFVFKVGIYIALASPSTR